MANENNENKKSLTANIMGEPNTTINLNAGGLFGLLENGEQSTIINNNVSNNDILYETKFESKDVDIHNLALGGLVGYSSGSLEISAPNTENNIGRFGAELTADFTAGKTNGNNGAPVRVGGLVGFASGNTTLNSVVSKPAS